jgi:uncharacterized protein (DUF934 family)
LPATQDLVRFVIIVIAFRKFTDGRGYSLARKLRTHYGYAGELRASGEILFDPAAIPRSLRLRQFRNNECRHSQASRGGAQAHV